MRTVILLLLALALLLTGCPGSDPTHPNSVLGDGALAPVDEPIIEMFDLPADYVDPPMERTGASVTEGSITLAGSVKMSGSPSPQAYVHNVSAADVVLLHWKAQASGGVAELLTIEVAVPGFSSTYQVPVDGEWHYKAVYAASSGACTFKVHNRPDVAGGLNPGAAIVEYFFKNQIAEGAREPNDDENPATVSDYYQGNGIDTGLAITQSVYQVPTKATKDLEDWYRLSVDTLMPHDRILTFSTYGQRYAPMSYRITFYAETLPYSFSISKLQRVGLPFILSEKTIGKAFRLSHKYHWYYMQVVAIPHGLPPGSNIQYQLNLVEHSQPTGIQYIEGDLRQAGFVGDAAVRPFSAATYSPYGDIGYSWDFGGGAVCTSLCTGTRPVLTLQAAGTYTGRLDIDMGSGLTDSKEFQYTVEQLDPTWTFNNPNVPTNMKWPVIVADSNFTHLIFLNSTSGQLQHSELTGLGITNTTTVLRGAVSMARRSAIIHRGRIFIAYVEATSGYLFLLVSRDTHPQSENDWIQYTFATEASKTFPVQLAALGDTLSLTYGASVANTTAMLARAIVPEPVSASDWDQHPVMLNTLLEQATIASHNGRWWIATMTDAGLLRLGYSINLQPISESDWVWMDLATQGEPGDKREGIPRLLTVGDRLAVAYSRRDLPEITSMIGISQHPMPFNAGHFRWTAVDYPAMLMGVPGIALGTGGGRIFGFTGERYDGNGYLAFGDLPASGQAVSLLRKPIMDRSGSMLYSVSDMAYESESQAIVVAWADSSGYFELTRLDM